MTFRQRAYFGVLLAVHLIVALVTLPMLEALKQQGAYFVVLSLLLGIGAGQILLLGLWLATVQLPLVTRVIGTSLAGAELLLAWAIGSRVAQQGIAVGIETGAVGFASICFAAVLMAGIMRNIWFLRDFRIFVADESAIGRQFHLRQLFGLMALVAMLLAAARLVRWRGSFTALRFGLDDLGGIAVLELGVALFVVVEFLILLPLLSRCFSSRDDADPAVTFALVVPFAAVVVLLLFCLVAGMMGSNLDGALMGVIFPFHFAELLTVSTSLFALRQIGFRLEREFRP